MPTTMFPLGKAVMTKGVEGLLSRHEITQLLFRHTGGDWGDLVQSDKDLNDQALESGEGRIFSSYETEKGKVWVITEHDRSVTTVLLPSEY